MIKMRLLTETHTQSNPENKIGFIPISRILSTDIAIPIKYIAINSSFLDIPTKTEKSVEENMLETIMAAIKPTKKIGILKVPFFDIVKSNPTDRGIMARDRISLSIKPRFNDESLKADVAPNTLLVSCIAIAAHTPN